MPPDPHLSDWVARLHAHLSQASRRVLLLAESDGRRESLLELLRDNKIEPPSVATLAEFETGEAANEKFAITAAPLPGVAVTF